MMPRRRWFTSTSLRRPLTRPGRSDRLGREARPHERTAGLDDSFEHVRESNRRPQIRIVHAPSDVRSKAIARSGFDVHGYAVHTGERGRLVREVA
jgi:hypothetical protein